MKHKFISIFIALVLVLSFSLVTAVPVAAATIIHVPGDYDTIQEAITAAGPDNIIIVAAGTHVGDFVIPADKTNLELVGAEGAVIKGSATWIDGEWPYTEPNINILSPGVKIHGFTIEGPDVPANEYASGMLIGAPNVEIYDNAFKVTADKETIPNGVGVSQAIQTWRKTVEGFDTVDISGLNIHDNTFTNLGVGVAGYEGIFVNLDTGEGTITIADNEFTGNIYRAISVERSNVVISGNTIETDLAPYANGAGGYQGIYMGCFPVEGDEPLQTDVSITGNTVGGSGVGKGFVQGIRVGHSTASLGFSAITVSQNTVKWNTDGIVVRAPNLATVGVVINHNNIVDNTNLGVNNATTDDILIDATSNWWGTEVGTEILTMVSGNVDYSLWLGAEYIPSAVDLDATYTPPVIGISVDTASVSFGEVTPGLVATGTPLVTVNNIGTVAVDLDATIENESPAGVYTAPSPNGLTIGGSSVSAWEAQNIADDGDTGPLTLQLTVPTGTAPGNYRATLIFWAEATTP